MNIQTAQFTATGMILINGETHVADTGKDRDRWGITAWLAEDEANVIDPYVAPPPPTDTERIDSAFPQSDVARVIFEAFFELTNKVRALEDSVNGTSQGGVTRVQLKNWLIAKLP